MATFRVVVTDQVFPDLSIEEAILGSIDAEVLSPRGARDTLPDAAESADALLNTYLPLSRAEIIRLKQCRIIARYGIGVDNIDLVAAHEAGIVVTNVPDYSVEEVAVHTVALLLSLLRRLPLAMERASRGEWGIDALRPIRRLSQITVGIVGLGRIGSRVAALLLPMGPRILGFDPYATGSREGIELVGNLDDLLRASDVVTLHLPATDQTRGVIGADALATMRPEALLINTSRGALVNTADLAAALRGGHLGGAALDVLEREAADVGEFAGLGNVILTPHMAYYSESSLEESQRKAATQVLKVLTGQEPDYPVVGA